MQPMYIDYLGSALVCRLCTGICRLLLCWFALGFDSSLKFAPPIGMAIYEVVRIIHDVDGVISIMYFCEWQELRHHE